MDGYLLLVKTIVETLCTMQEHALTAIHLLTVTEYVYLMFPWIRGQIAEAWNNRRSSRLAERHSLTQSSNNARNLDPNDVTMLASSSITSDSFPINIISLEGKTLEIAVKSDFTIQKIKSIATKHFYGQDASKPILHFRLIHVTKYKQLCDDRKIEDEDIKESDELLLTEIRPVAAKENLSEDALKGPSEEAIAKVTQGLTIRNPPRPIPTVDYEIDFQNEIRKILITLIQASAKILMHGPEAVKFYEIIRERLKARCKPPNDPKAVKYLTDMGFTEKKVLKALRLRKMNTSEALEWLIEHKDDPDEDDLELPSLDLEQKDDRGGPSTSGTFENVGGSLAKRKSFKEACTDFFKGGSHGTKRKPNLVNVVTLLLESFRQYRKLDFKPNLKAKQFLQEMGFEEEKIIEALRITGNNQSNACEWLLGERSRSLQVDEGLDIDGLMYQAIMNNPHIQLSLTNPKMLLVYLSMLETPSSVNVWINDPEASPVLSQILKTYHAEKHAITMNRYVTS